MAQFTERAIRESFVKLLNERPLDKITVKDITEDCGVTRNTFYYHFPDVLTLLRQILQVEIDKVMEGTVENLSWEDSFIQGAQFALENKRLIYHIYNSIAREEIERYLNSVAGEVMRRYVERAAADLRVSAQDKELIASFYSAALVGMILDWLNTAMKNDPVLLIKRLGVMLEGNIQTALKRVEED